MSTCFKPAAAARRLSLALLILLASCGGGGSGPEDPPSSGPTPDAAEAWEGELPASSPIIPESEFMAGLASGELVLTGPATWRAQRAAADRALADDRALLEPLAADIPAARVLLDAAAASADPFAAVSISIDGFDHPIAAQGPAAGLAALARAQRSATDVGDRLAVYRQLHAFLPDALKAELAAPDSLTGRPLEAVQAALADLDARLAQRAAAPPVQPLGIADRARALAAPLPGLGYDTGGQFGCEATNLIARHWFAQSAFLGPVRDQGVRNTCWGFTAIAALEVRERVQRGENMNLSEQFLVNQVRAKWVPNDYVESGDATSALNEAYKAGQVIPAESVWTYNSAPNRPNVDAYTRICEPYGRGPYAGTCGDTAHESGQPCTLIRGMKFCSNMRVSYSGPGAAPAQAKNMWRNGQPFPLASLRENLAQGVPLLVDLRLYPGFREVKTGGAQRGVLTNTGTLRFDANGKLVDAAKGTHQMLIVGFLPNEQLVEPGDPPPDAAGGGYFVVRNSWGCGYGDGGYVYMPVEYAKKVFNTIDTPLFDGARSAAWAAEQAYPGSSIVPAMQAKTALATADLRVPFDLASVITLTHPFATSVRLVVRSDVEGVIYDGPWVTDRRVVAGNRVPHAFGATGRHLLGFTAYYGPGTSERAGVAVDVVNTRPSLLLRADGFPRQGEPYAVSAQPQDPNEADPGVLCRNAQWLISAPDTISGAGGCAKSITFATSGSRTIEVSTFDSDGLGTTSKMYVEVLPALANPYPRITAAGVFSREMVGGLLKICSDVAVPDGGTIDLSQIGCSASTEAPPWRFSGQVQVENPTAEYLEYEWNVFVTIDGVESSLYGNPIEANAPLAQLRSPGNQADVLHDCRVAVTVRPPEPERSKTRTVWTGRCSYKVGRPV